MAAFIPSIPLLARPAHPLRAISHSLHPAPHAPASSSPSRHAFVRAPHACLPPAREVAAPRSAPPAPLPPVAHIVLICGFETFNLATYRAAAAAVLPRRIRVTVLTDTELQARDPRVVHALRAADVVFCSLVFDYDQVEWLRALLPREATVFVFESALELMADTRVGTFSIGGKGREGKGVPAVVKSVLRKLGLAGREEDKLAGYLTLLKSAPKVLRMVPGKTARDLRHWLSVYAYWNAGGAENVVAMLEYIADSVLEVGTQARARKVKEVVQVPSVGLVHPARQEYYFEHPGEYIEWYMGEYPERTRWPRVGVLLYRKHVVSRLAYIPQLIGFFEEAELVPVPVFVTGVEGHIIARDYFTSEFKESSREAGRRIYGSLRRGKTAQVDALVSTIGFPLVGGPAGSMAGARNADVGQVILKQLNVPYIIAAPLLIQDLQSWRSSGVAGLQSVVLYSLPELDGAIDTVCIGALVGEEVLLIRDRVDRLTGRIKKWTTLRRKANKDKKVAIIIYGFPPSVGATGTAALLNVPRSLVNIIRRMSAEGYNVGNGTDLSAQEILDMVKQSDEVMQGGKLDASSARDALKRTTTVASSSLREWLGPVNTSRVEKSWNGDIGSSKNIKTIERTHLLGGLELGNIWIGVQPPLGILGDPMRMMFERDLTPHPQYTAFYGWLENGLQVDATIHLGTHGTYEWLPGNAIGNTAESWSDIVMGNLPNIYVYAANNPSEASLAKRRGYATIVSHNVPPYGRTALYGQLDDLKSLIWDFNEARLRSDSSERGQDIWKAIEEKLELSGLNVDLGMEKGTKPTPEHVEEVEMYLKTLQSRLFSSGLHVLGQPPTIDEAVGFMEAVLGENAKDLPEDERLSVARSIVHAKMGTKTEANQGLLPSSRKSTEQSLNEIGGVQQANAILDKLLETGNELDSIVRGLNGEFIEALPGGDVLRDGAGVLPTGSNIHALDPYRLPSQAAFTTGRAIAARVIDTHRKANNGQYPETIAVPLWGLDNIKTKGESVGIALGFIGAEPVLDSTGRVVRFALLSLQDLGRPRIDVLLNLSGIFRDTFEHIIFLLDDVCRRAAEAAEPLDQNFVKKHAVSIANEGADIDGAARIFSNPPADYGSMVSEQVAESSWETGDELAATFVSRNAYVYGRQVSGRRNKSALKKMLSTTSRVVQQIDSVEYGLSDIQEYYANTGALLRAARTENKRETVGTSIVESFGAAGDGGAGREPKELEQVLRMELRTRLLNPKWAEQMLANDAGGAFEVSTRMTALIGWGGTASFGDNFVFEQAAENYVLNEDNREKLRKASPEAYRNILSRFLEASGRGIWKEPSEDIIQKIRDELDQVDSELEGIHVG